MAADVPLARAGVLLVAGPGLTDPNFAGSVVLLVDVDDNGALGVVLNRPSAVPVGQVLERWTGAVGDLDVLFHGGPVSPDSALAVAVLADPTAVPVGVVSIEGALGLVDLDTPVELLAQTLAGLRIFAGYAGWGVEQLMGEIGRGDWYLVPAQPDDVLGRDPVGLRRDVLRRQPGELAWLSTRPADPDRN